MYIPFRLYQALPPTEPAQGFFLLEEKRSFLQLNWSQLTKIEEKLIGQVSLLYLKK